MDTQLFWFVTRGAGVVSLLLTTAVVYLGILSVLRWRTPAWPPFATAGLHRNLSLLSGVFLLVHVVTAIVDPYTALGPIAALIPFASSYRTLWLGLGVIVLDLGVALVVTSLLRRHVGQRAWRAVHWTSYLAWPLAVVHAIGTGTDARSPWLLAVIAGCVFAVVAATAIRIVNGRPEAVPRRTALVPPAQ